jgi:hypothetical protein
MGVSGAVPLTGCCTLETTVAFHGRPRFDGEEGMRAGAISDVIHDSGHFPR